MRIFQIWKESGFEFIRPVRSEDILDVFRMNGTRRRAGWKPVRMVFDRVGDEGESLEESDAPWLGDDVLFLRTSAVDRMSDMLLLYGELLPVEANGSRLFVFNVTTVLDALDEDRSDVERLRSGGIVIVRRPVFKSEVVADNDVFKVTSLRAGPIYVSERFVDRWQRSRLRGLKFDLVWQM